MNIKVDDTIKFKLPKVIEDYKSIGGSLNSLQDSLIDCVGTVIDVWENGQGVQVHVHYDGQFELPVDISLVDRVIKTHSGSAYDRGSADRYYNRERSPHFYYNKNKENEMLIEESRMTDLAIDDYNLGYDFEMDRKVWE